MDLRHRFTVATPVEEAWERLRDVSEIAACFPGTRVTSAGGDRFEGTCKVEHGPVALVYTGSGGAVERDDEARRLLLGAEGRADRGDGSAGARVSLQLQPEGAGTVVDVTTDLTIDGAPAGPAGVLREVADRLFGQFVGCLEQRLGEGGATEHEDPDAGPASAPTGAAAGGAPGEDPDAGPASVPGPAQGAPVAEPPAPGT